ncbi:MAG: XcyI family restriction endonuclease [Beijerinckiaceae bacterium]|nr:XcyI family restriction endonuclease [Beijerinckiaceae bacterium]
MVAIPEPRLQVNFARILGEVRGTMLQEALGETVRRLQISELDKELAGFVPAGSLAALAGHGLRGELMFAVPMVLAENPKLLGYYRLLYGYSQKEFYASSVAGKFKPLEERGSLTEKNKAGLEILCREMAAAGALLLAGISTNAINVSLLDDLTLLTLGPQLRGGANVRTGSAAIAAVFGVIESIVSGSVAVSGSAAIELKNAAGRKVLIEFAPDPDIIIREEMRAGIYRQLIAIEIKGGRDFSNIHNRIGEAEKSHQKARAAGYVECWTVVNVDNIDLEMARRESPSTNRFYRMSDLIAASGPEYQDFWDRLVSLTGVPVDLPD